MSQSVYKLCISSILNDVIEERKNVNTSRESKIRMCLFLYYVLLKLIQIIV